MTEREIQPPFFAEDDANRLIFLACAIIVGSGIAMLIRAVLA